MKLNERFENFIIKTNDNDCWLWNAATQGVYGVFWFEGKHIMAHRLSYILYNKRTIPDGLIIRHICRCKLCVNQKNLE